MPYYVYILLCEDGSYYTGYAKDLEPRVRQHMKGIGPRYTRLRKPKRLVYKEEFDTRREAMKREMQIKKMSHKRKQELVSSLLV